MGSLRSLVLLAAIGATLSGLALITHEVANQRHAAGTRPDTSPAVTACELRITVRVAVPAPADMSFTQVQVQPAPGGGYTVSGTVDAHPAAQLPLLASWRCDVEQRPTGWTVWYTSVTPVATAVNASR